MPTFDRTAGACCLGFCLVASAAPASGQAITPELLQGSTIVATVNYETHGRFGGQENTGPTSVTYQLVIGAGGAYTGSVTRSGYRATATQQFSGTLGRAREAKGSISGHVVWLLSGNTLTMLRTYQIGGKNTTITFGPGARSCTVRSPFMREVGAGSSIKRETLRGGGTTEIISAKQTSSSCQVTRG
jgi:hypothetical protein